jgi:hypothetical protein
MKIVQAYFHQNTLEVSCLCDGLKLNESDVSLPNSSYPESPEGYLRENVMKIKND